MKNRTFYRPELDLLRFLAFAQVFLFHFGCQYLERNEVNLSAVLRLKTAVIRTGALGVDLFFCLSAFLITTLLLKECDAKGTFSLKNFFARRALRILPLYYVVVVALCYIHPLQPVSHKISALFLTPFTGNLPWMVWNAAPWSLAHLWSVSMEEQFYLVWALVLWFKPKQLKLSSLCLIALVFSAAAKVIVAVHGWNMGMNTPARLDGIIAGIFLADLVHRRGWAPSGARRIELGAIGLVLPFTAQWAIGSGSNRLPALAFYPLVAIGCMCLIAALYKQEHFKVPKRLAYLGKISYGLYMFHMPVQFWFMTRLSHPGIHASLKARLVHANLVLFGSAGATVVLSMSRTISLRSGSSPGRTSASVARRRSSRNLFSHRKSLFRRWGTRRQPTSDYLTL